jgi:hypothetical protein
MSEQLIHELFRGVESVVHERLVIAEDVLQKKQSSELAEMVKVQGYKIDNLSMQLHKLSEQIAILTSLKASQINHPFIHPDSVAFMPQAPMPQVPMPQAPMPVAEPILKNVTIGPCVSAIDMAEEEVVEEEEVLEEEVLEEEVEVEEEEEAQEVELEEFIYKKKTYYKDGENQVYQMDSEGNLDESPIGMWNEQTQRIHPMA